MQLGSSWFSGGFKVVPTIVITIFVFGSITIVILYLDGSIDRYPALLDAEDGLGEFNEFEEFKELELVELVGVVLFGELGMVLRTGVKGVEDCGVEFSIFFLYESDVFFRISMVSDYMGWTTELSDLFKVFPTIFIVELVITLVDIFVYYFLIEVFATSEISFAPGMPNFFSVCSHFPIPLY